MDWPWNTIHEVDGELRAPESLDVAGYVRRVAEERYGPVASVAINEVEVDGEDGYVRAAVRLSPDGTVPVVIKIRGADPSS